LSQAFKLNTEVQERAERIPALRKEYLKLSERCKRFATDLHNSCKNIEEFAALLGIDIEEFRSDCDEKMRRHVRVDVARQLRRAVDSKHLEV
jgi:hypothetical protein